MDANKSDKKKKNSNALFSLMNNVELNTKL